MHCLCPFNIYKIFLKPIFSFLFFYEVSKDIWVPTGTRIELELKTKLYKILSLSEQILPLATLCLEKDLIVITKLF